MCFIHTKFCLKEFTRIIQTIYLVDDKNNFRINLQTKNQKIIRVKFCLKESTGIIQVTHLMNDKKQFSNKFNCENTENYPSEILPERINNNYSANLSDE